MNDEHFTPPAERGLPADRRPLGHWLRVVDRLITREFATALEAEGVSRRDWMLLNVVSGDAPELLARMERGGKRLRRLEDRGWIVRADGRWQLTDEGRAAKDRLSEIVDGVRAKVSGAVSPEDWARLTASLEAIARELGWKESDGMPRSPRRFGRRRGRGRGFGRGFRHGHRFGPERFGPGFGYRHGHRDGHGFDADDHCGHGGHGPGGHGHHGHGHSHRHAAQEAYERGFDAGFTRGRDEASAA